MEVDNKKSEKITEWDQKINQIRNNIFQTYKNIGDLLEDIELAMTSGVVRIEDHIIDDSIWNGLGLFFFNLEDFSVSETVYSHMLRTIQRFTDRRLHKGLALYNLGVSQINSKNFDDGIPNILLAYEQDVERMGKIRARKFFANKLKDTFLDYEINFIESNYLNKLRKLFPNSSISTLLAQDLFKVLDESEMLLLMKIIVSITVRSFNKDDYSKLTRFDSLKNIYLLIEIVLKKRQKKTLAHLVDDMFTREKWLSPSLQEKKLRRFDTGPNSPIKQFNINLKNIRDMNFYGNEQKFLVRIFLLTVLMRNYTAHFFDEYHQLLNDRNIYSSLFESAIYALLYCLRFR